MSISGLVAPEPEPTEAPATEPTDENGISVPDSTNVEPTKEPETTPEPPRNEFLEALLNKIEPVESRTRYLKMLIYSDPGQGKTSILGQIPNNFIYDVEDGLESLDNLGDLRADGVQRLAHKTFAGFEQVVKTFHDAPPELSHFKTFSLDSLSELHKRGLAEVTEREHRRNPNNNRYVAETEHHGENNEHVRRLASALRDLPMNLVITAHAKTVEPKDKPSKTYPDFSERLANVISGMVDIVVYLKVKEVDGKHVRFAQFHGNEQLQAKSRVGGFPVIMEDPTWEKIWTIFSANKSSLTD